MDRRQFLAVGAVAGAATGFASRTSAFMGGAFIDHAVPGVGLTVSGPVREVRLYFDLGVAAARVQVMTSVGTVIPVSRAFIDSQGRDVVAVRLGRALGPGSYLVNWDVISVAGISTGGTFHFMVA